VTIAALVPSRDRRSSVIEPKFSFSADALTSTDRHVSSPARTTRTTLPSSTVHTSPASWSSPVDTRQVGLDMVVASSATSCSASP
jgi:hypothetical protein